MSCICITALTESISIRHNAMKRIIMLSATRISLTAYHDEEKYTANNEDHEYKLNNLVKK